MKGRSPKYMSADRLKRKKRPWKRKMWWTINERYRRIGHPRSR